MDNCNINLGAVKAKEIDGELYISCWNFSKALSEKEREISDLCKENDEQKEKISELESELETAEYAFNHIRDCSKSQFDKNEKQEKEIKHWRDEAQKQSWRVSELNRALCIKGDLLKKANEKIAELESELSAKEDLLKIKNGLRDEEPLPFSCDACSECYEADLQELQHTHLKDRMTISKLKIAIGVLTEQYAELREEKGLTDTQS